MNGALVPLPEERMAVLAPNWASMRIAIANCERVDEIKALSDKAIALRAYYAQSQDITNEVAAMRVRLRAERRLGQLIRIEQDAGRLAKQENGRPSEASSVRRLSDHGIPYNRSARAQDFADVPEEQFEAALQAERPSARAVASLRPTTTGLDVKPDALPRQPIDVQPVLKTWGTIHGPLDHWCVPFTEILPAVARSCHNAHDAEKRRAGMRQRKHGLNLDLFGGAA